MAAASLLRRIFIHGSVRLADRIRTLAGAAVLVLLASTAAWAGVRSDHPNLVGGEILGRGIILTLNYERFLTNAVGLGGGVMVIASGGETAAIVPLYASLLAGDENALYTSAGATFVGGGSAQDFQNTTLFQLSVGYHHQSKGGFFVRPLFTYMVEPDTGDFLIWPGLTIGGSF
jgi:hypothetical protein